MKIKVAPSDYISSKGTPKKVEIPVEVESLVKRLNRKYELDFEAVPVNGKLLHFLHVADIEPLVKGKDVFAHAEEFPFWVKIWEASVMMANFMRRYNFRHTIVGNSHPKIPSRAGSRSLM